jgi:protoheme IX farnesyltransferase
MKTSASATSTARPPSTATTTRSLRAIAREFLELTKPRVVTLIVFTAIVGMFLSSPGFLPLGTFVFATLGIALAAGSAAAFNHVLDQTVDAEMARTRRRPLPTGYLSTREALGFAFAIGALSMVILTVAVNGLTAVLTFASLIGYSVIYTLYLKRATPQNIVIGGAAGAAPPVLGWTAMTGEVHADALLLFLIIFAWTPPHFWALALYRRNEYAKVNIPMLPVTHGVEFTRLHVLLYTVLLTAVTLLPFGAHMTSWLYLVGVIPLNAVFLWYAWRLYRDYSDRLAHRTFRYSIQYLALLFALLLADHYTIPIREALQSALY